MCGVGVGEAFGGIRWWTGGTVIEMDSDDSEPVLNSSVFVSKMADNLSVVVTVGRSILDGYIAYTTRKN